MRRVWLLAFAYCFFSSPASAEEKVACIVYEPDTHIMEQVIVPDHRWECDQIAFHSKGTKQLVVPLSVLGGADPTGPFRESIPWNAQKLVRNLSK
jgi:hypothetical protein